MMADKHKTWRSNSRRNTGKERNAHPVNLPGDMTSRGWDFILWLDTKTTINRWSRMSMTPSYNSRHWWETRGMERWYSHGFQWEKFVWEEKQILCWLREECYARFDCRQEVKVEKRRTAATVKEKGEAVFAWRPKRKEEKQRWVCAWILLHLTHRKVLHFLALDFLFRQRVLYQPKQRHESFASSFLFSLTLT